MLLSQLTAKQWADWKAFYSLDPWGDWRQDRRFAMMAALLMARKGKKVDMEDFMLFNPEKDRRKKQRQKAGVVKLKGWFETMAARGAKGNKQ